MRRSLTLWTSIARRWSASASGVSRKALKQRCGRVHHASCIRGSWTASRRPPWSHSRAVRHQTGVGGGRCVLLADKLVELEIVDGISHETVRQTLKKRTEALAQGAVLSAGATSGEFVYRMEDVLDVYTRP